MQELLSNRVYTIFEEGFDIVLCPEAEHTVQLLCGERAGSISLNGKKLESILRDISPSVLEELRDVFRQIDFNGHITVATTL
jgi:hypothetical protein